MIDRGQFLLKRCVSAYWYFKKVPSVTLIINGGNKKY